MLLFAPQFDLVLNMNIPAFSFGISICLLAVVVLTFVPMLRNRHRQNKNVKSAEHKLSQLIDTHIDTLVCRRLETVKTDRYGVEDFSEWYEEMIHFRNKVWLPQLTTDEVAVLDHTSSFSFEIDKAVFQFFVSKCETDEKSESQPH